MTVAGDFFGERDLNKVWGIVSADDAWTVLSTLDPSELVGVGWPTTLTSGSSLFFRGQPNTDYGLSSKLYRDIKSALRLSGSTRSVDEVILRNVEQTMIKTVRAEGIGRRMTDGELLMVMQHHGIATRLIDVSDAPLEALFFAVDHEPDKDGRLFLLHPHESTSSFAGRLHLNASPRLPWEDARWGTRAAGDWTTTVAAVMDDAVDPRMRAQQGHFLVGGLNRRYAGNRMLVGQHDLNADEFVEVTTLNINFLRRKPSRINPGWGGTGWCLRIHASWKAELFARLATMSEPITPDSMYPPVGEVSRLARRTLERVVQGL